mgnify:FL=1
MGTKIFGIIASAAIVVVIAFALLNFGNYHTLLPERAEPVAEATEEVATVDTTAVETDVAEADSIAVEVVDSLTLAPTDTLQIEQ